MDPLSLLHERTDRACLGADAELFFPDQGAHHTVHAAKQFCSRCPIQQECLSYALDNPSLAGVWGGTTQKERAYLLRRRRKAA